MTVVMRGDALAIPLRDESVDLIVTSPPYFGQRSYRDGGEHYDGQIGSEPTPQAFLEVLWAVTAECWRVLKPSGSMFVNLGDKRSGSGAPGTTSGLGGAPQGNRTGMSAGAPGRNERAPGRAQYVKAAFGRAKSKQLLPHRYAIGCEDGLADPEGIGWIVRQDLVWSKPNGLPESVRDRTRDAHEYWFHLCKQGNYFAAIDEIRMPSGRPRAGEVQPDQDKPWLSGNGVEHRAAGRDSSSFDPRGPLPSSVWSIATEPLKVPAELGVDHFAAFPTEWPRRLILGFSPSGTCTACGSARQPVTYVEHERYRAAGASGRPKRQELNGSHGGGVNVAGYPQTVKQVTITGYGCACPDSSAPTRPAVVLDPFGGTGTTAMVARALDRTGISLDLSADYCRLASWRVFDSPGAGKVADRTNGERQEVLAL